MTFSFWSQWLTTALCPGGINYDTSLLNKADKFTNLFSMHWLRYFPSFILFCEPALRDYREQAANDAHYILQVTDGEMIVTSRFRGFKLDLTFNQSLLMPCTLGDVACITFVLYSGNEVLATEVGGLYEWQRMFCGDISWSLLRGRADRHQRYRLCIWHLPWTAVRSIKKIKTEA